METRTAYIMPPNIQPRTRTSAGGSLPMVMFSDRPAAKSALPVCLVFRASGMKIADTNPLHRAAVAAAVEAGAVAGTFFSVRVTVAGLDETLTVQEAV